MGEGNSEQRQLWDRRAGAWDRRAEALDSMSDDYATAVMDALALQPGERVLDLGCGPGTTVAELARRVGPTGEVLGVDLSPAMVAAATRRAAAKSLSGVRFLVADAGTDSLGEGFDAAFSRFGVMFFDDPVSAFANIRRSLRPGGRLACAVWGPLSENPWMYIPTLAAVGPLGAEMTMPAPGQPGPFSLDRPERVTEVLAAAGLADVSVEPVRGTRHITAATAGDDVTTLLEVGPLGDAYEAAGESSRRQAVEAVMDALEPYRQGSAWRIPGLALKVMAKRA